MNVSLPGEAVSFALESAKDLQYFFEIRIRAN